MTDRSAQSAARGSKSAWTPTRTIQALAALCVALAAMCVGLALMWQRQPDAAECWRAAAEYHLAPETGGGQPVPETS
jgi:hypothetical protein